MRTFHVSDFNAPADLIYRTTSVPRKDQVLIDIRACGLNFAYLLVSTDKYNDSLCTLLDWYEQDKIRPHISHTFPLEEAETALELLRQRKSTGKIVVTMDASD